MPYTVLLAVQPQNRENLSTFHVSTLRALFVFFQVVVVLPLFQMLQYPEMDDSMGPNLRRIDGGLRKNRWSEALFQNGGNMIMMNYVYVYIYIIHIYIYIMMEICYTLYSVDGNMMKYVIPLNMIFLPI